MLLEDILPYFQSREQAVEVSLSKQSRDAAWACNFACPLEMPDRRLRLPLLAHDIGLLAVRQGRQR